MILQILTLLGALALFVFGLEMLSSGIQKSCGDRLRNFEKWMTSGNPLKQILSGAGITAVVQSSSATTILVASLVSVATLSLKQGISVIMGANIGTTVTAWIIAATGFYLDVTVLAFVLLGVGFVMTLMKKSLVKNIGQAVIGLSLVFVGLIYIKSSIPAIETVPEMAESIAALSSHGIGSVLIFMLVGIVVTFILQSSSATVALTMVLAYLGWISFPMAAAMVLGENIGTTISGNIAAGKAGVQARRAALAHTVFNVAGSLFVLIFFNIFIKINLWIVSMFGPSAGMTSVFGVACVHTLFNVVATLVLVWFRKPLARLLAWWIKEPAPEKGDFHLRFIGSGRIVGTPSISIEQAYKEAVNFATTAQEGFQYVKLALCEKDPDKFEEYRQRLVKCEEVTDRFEYEIAAFLNSITTESLNDNEAREIKVIYRVISELESLGDSCENISRLLMRLRVHKLEFDDETVSKLNLLIGKVNHAFAVMVFNLKLAVSGGLKDISNAYNAEDVINVTRDTLRNEGILQIEKGADKFLAINYYLDMLAELEAMGDFMINISQSLFHEFDN